MFLKIEVLKLFLACIVFKTFNVLFLYILHFTFCRFAILPFLLCFLFPKKFEISSFLIFNLQYYLLGLVEKVAPCLKIFLPQF